MRNYLWLSIRYWNHMQNTQSFTLISRLLGFPGHPYERNFRNFGCRPKYCKILTAFKTVQNDFLNWLTFKRPFLVSRFARGSRLTRPHQPLALIEVVCWPRSISPLQWELLRNDRDFRSKITFMTPKAIFLEILR